MDNLELDHIFSLEQTLCSNFTCCSKQLADLHALVEHVEDTHVLGGDSFFLPSLSHSASSSRSSSVVSSPQTQTTPLDPVYTPFNIGIGLYNHDLEFGPDPYPVISSQFDSDSEKSLFIPEPSCGNTRLSLSTSKKTTTRTPKSKSKSKADIVNTTPVFVKNSSVKTKARISSSSASSSSNSSATSSSMTANGKRREKAFRCPTLGCTKSYLNPNGLKYHVEKGTCRFEETSYNNSSSTDSGTESNSSIRPSPTPALAPPSPCHLDSHHQYQGTIPTTPSTQTPPLSIPLNSLSSSLVSSDFGGNTSNDTNFNATASVVLVLDNDIDMKDLNSSISTSLSNSTSTSTSTLISSPSLSSFSSSPPPPLHNPTSIPNTMTSTNSILLPPPASASALTYCVSTSSTPASNRLQFQQPQFALTQVPC